MQDRGWRGVTVMHMQRGQNLKQLEVQNDLDALFSTTGAKPWF